MLNEKIKKAIEEAVLEEEQSPELAAKILAWMEALTEGNEDVADSSSYLKRCALCFENTVVSKNIEA